MPTEQDSRQQLTTESDIRAHVAAKAEADSAFRAQLVADPRAAVEAEFNVSFPGHISLHVHEQSPSDVHLVLPLSGRRLTDEELKRVAGGGPNPAHW